MKTTPFVPYPQIDAEVRGLVELLNEFPCLRTTSSCAGHGDPAESYVKFTAECLEALHFVTRTLPFAGARSVMGIQPVMEAVWITTEIDDGGELEFKLHVSAFPEPRRRFLVGQVECALATALGEPEICRSGATDVCRRSAGS